MRVTNNMILHNTSNNINANKVNVDILNDQMTTQKKIQRPSEDPVVAIRALRLRSSLSEINQYYEKNIPDAESWLEVTESALSNMVSITEDIRYQCIYGASDELTTDDRNTILTQMQALREQVYAEANADYAGRTIFTGYRTNQQLTFTTDEDDTAYRITQEFSYSDIEEYNYFSGSITLPTSASEVLSNTISDPSEVTYNRIRLSYGEVEADPTITYTLQDGTETSITPTVYESYSDWEAATDGECTIADGEAVFIQETGELILSDDLASTLKSGLADISITYEKQGFDEGELRPEYYYNCVDISDPDNAITYTKFDEDGNEIYQDINYTVSGNQTMTININASDVFDSSLGRDVDELITAVQRAIDADNKVEELESMKDMQEYASDECQAMLDEWIAAAEKERDYADNNMQELFNKYIGNCDDYLEKLNLGLTTVGTKGDSLDLIKERVSNQQTTVETLKSSNEDRELSDIIIDYTAAYNAYTNSLQAAAKLNQTTLLNYL